MKKSVFRAIITSGILFLFFSCSNDQTVLSGGASYDHTLRIQFREQFDGVEWTEELEGDLLSQRKQLDEALFARRSLETAEGASVVQVPYSEWVHPSIAGFGSLDIGSLSAGLRQVVDSFCEALLDLSRNKTKSGVYTTLASMMVPGRSYMLSIYLYDTSSYPAAQRFYLGAPFVQGTYWEVPVLFVGEAGSWTMAVHVVQQDEQWRVEQIRYGEFVYE